jgi:putative redox protein
MHASLACIPQFETGGCCSFYMLRKVATHSTACHTAGLKRSSVTRVVSTFASPRGSDDNSRIDKEGFIKRYQLHGATTEDNNSGVTVHTSAGHVGQTDLPVRMGGKNSAPEPVEILLVAWMGCTQATAMFVSRNMKPERLILERLEFFNIEAARDVRGALSLPIAESPAYSSRLQHISGSIVVYAQEGKEIGVDELALLREQTELRCPVANMMIASGCQLLVEWVDGNARW